MRKRTKVGVAVVAALLGATISSGAFARWYDPGTQAEIDALNRSTWNSIYRQQQFQENFGNFMRGDQVCPSGAYYCE